MISAIKTFREIQGKKSKTRRSSSRSTSRSPIRSPRTMSRSPKKSSKSRESFRETPTPNTTQLVKNKYTLRQLPKPRRPSPVYFSFNPSSEVIMESLIEEVIGDTEENWEKFSKNLDELSTSQKYNLIVKFNKTFSELIPIICRDGKRGRLNERSKVIELVELMGLKKEKSFIEYIYDSLKIKYLPGKINPEQFTYSLLFETVFLFTENQLKKVLLSIKSEKLKDKLDVMYDLLNYGYYPSFFESATKFNNLIKLIEKSYIPLQEKLMIKEVINELRFVTELNRRRILFYFTKSTSFSENPFEIIFDKNDTDNLFEQHFMILNNMDTIKSLTPDNFNYAINVVKNHIDKYDINELSTILANLEQNIDDTKVLKSSLVKNMKSKCNEFSKRNCPEICKKRLTKCSY